jgi:hypothetical protein
MNFQRAISETMRPKLPPLIPVPETAVSLARLSFLQKDGDSAMAYCSNFAGPETASVSNQMVQSASPRKEVGSDNEKEDEYCTEEARW